MESGWIAPRRLELPEGRFLVASLSTAGGFPTHVFYTCGSCGGSGCGSCSGLGYTCEVPVDRRSADLQREVLSYDLQFKLVLAVCQGVRADIDLAVFPANVRRSVAERVSRATLDGIGIPDDRQLCTGVASWLFAGEPEVTRSRAEVEAGKTVSVVEEEEESSDGDDEP